MRFAAGRAVVGSVQEGLEAMQASGIFDGGVTGEWGVDPHPPVDPPDEDTGEEGGRGDREDGKGVSE